MSRPRPGILMQGLDPKIGLHETHDEAQLIVTVIDHGNYELRENQAFFCRIFASTKNFC